MTLSALQITRKKTTPFQTPAELRLKVENCFCGSFNQFKWDCHGACLEPVLVSQQVTRVPLKTVAFQGGMGGGEVSFLAGLAPCLAHPPAAFPLAPGMDQGCVA